mmetsp:Transcript_46937/g.75142  ORF Transcript_46937/g.75142 Transcript_46937/m.75142 type:complete len:205 (-) Transcript_46937:433-1047(-)
MEEVIARRDHNVLILFLPIYMFQTDAALLPVFALLLLFHQLLRFDIICTLLLVVRLPLLGTMRVFQVHLIAVYLTLVLPLIILLIYVIGGCLVVFIVSRPHTLRYKPSRIQLVILSADHADLQRTPYNERQREGEIRLSLQQIVRTPIDIERIKQFRRRVQYHHFVLPRREMSRSHRMRDLKQPITRQHEEDEQRVGAIDDALR